MARGIKEIVLGMKTGPVVVEKEKDQHKKSFFKEVKEDKKKTDPEKPAKKGRVKILYAVTLLVVLVITGIFVYPRIFKRDTLDRLRSSGERISVAVMPFQNMSNDTIWNTWQNGIQDMLITSLSNNPENLIIRQTESIKSVIRSKRIINYTTLTPSIAGIISQKLDANVFIYGNIKQAGSTLRIYAQIIDSKSKEVLKSFQIEGYAKEENIFHVVDSLSVMLKDFLIISKLIQGETHDVKYEATTKYPEAFKYVIIGDNAYFKKRDYPTAINMYLRALALDSNYAYPAIMIPFTYYVQSLYEEGKRWCQKIYKKKDQMPLLYKAYANTIHALYYETTYEVIKYEKQLLEIDDQLPDVYNDLGIDYYVLKQYNKAIPAFEKTLEIYEKWGTKPLWVIDYTHLGKAYHETGQYNKENKLYRKAEKDFPDDLILIYRQAVLALSEGDTSMANQYIKNGISIAKENSISEAGIATSLGGIYSEAGVFDKAEEHLRKALSLETDKGYRINNLAYFLIDKDRNLNEGIELADKALNLDSDNYNYLNTKGWGLYKQGKYHEALEVLQKSWALRRQNGIYDHEAFLHLEEAKKAVANLK